MSDGLPSGWVRVPLSEVVDINPRHPKGMADEVSVSFAPMAALSEDGPQLDLREERPYGEVRKGFTHFSDGDVLFAKITPCMENGKGAVACGLRNGMGCGTTELHVLRPHGGIDAHFLYRFLAQAEVRRRAKENFTGSAGQARVPISFIEQLEIPLPPLAEQRRIVAKLEELLGRVDACRTRLATIPHLLKRFRQSVLAAACSGKLTADWREANGCDEEWPIAILGDVAELRLGKMLDDAKNRGEATGYLRNINVRWFAFDLTDVANMRATPAERTALAIQNGDLLVCEGGEPGRCAIWEGGKTDLVFQKAIHRIRPQDGVSSRWLALNIRNDATSKRLDDYFTGTTIKHLTGRSLACYRFPLPPLPEQQEIVRRVEALFALADAFETRYTNARAQVDRLTQSILAKAFRGELVPQDPDDEPAERLLERIESMGKGPLTFQDGRGGRRRASLRHGNDRP